jgi:ribosomal protein S18 acetylase RimI-like enzyme
MRIKVKHGSCIGTIYNNGKANIMVIDSVFVDPEYRRQGVGTRLIDKAIGIAIDKGLDCIELLVNPDNEFAKRLYEKVGFKKTNKEHHRLIL